MDSTEILVKEIASFKEKLSIFKTLTYIEKGQIQKDNLIKKNSYYIHIYLGMLGDKEISMKEFSIMKVLNITFDDFSKEINRALKTDHPALPKFYGVYFEGVHVYLIYELLVGVGLTKKSIDWTLKEKLDFLIKANKIISELHNLNLVHKGLRTSKYLIDSSNNVHLKELGDSDYDIGSLHAKNALESDKHFCAFYPPEKMTYDDDENEDLVNSGNNEKNQINTIETEKKFDVWSLGCIISHVCSGVIPWSNYNREGLKSKSLKINKEVQYLIEKKEFPIPDELTKELKEILSCCFKINPEQRCTSQELLNKLENYYNSI